MPKYKKYKKRYKRKQIIPRSPMPSSFVTKMRYCEVTSIDPTAGGVAADQIYRANDLYDPNYTGTGNQPRGFDELVGVLYDHFTVIGSKITVKAHNGSGTYAANVALCLRDNSDTISNIIDALETDPVTSAVLSEVSGGETKATLKLSFNNRFLGKRTGIINDSNLRGSATATPAEMAFYHIVAAPFVAADMGKIYLNVTIDYIVALTEPKTPSQS